jgi:hypothetical protein
MSLVWWKSFPAGGNWKKVKVFDFAQFGTNLPKLS